MSHRLDQRLMTLEEAMHLSALRNDPYERFERTSIWAWQTVARAMAQTVSDIHLVAGPRKTSRLNRYCRRQAG